MNYNLRGVFNLADAVITQAIIDTVDRTKKGKYKCSSSDFVTAKLFLKNNCDFWGDFFDLDEERIVKAIKKYKNKQKYLKEKKVKSGKRQPRVLKKVICVETGVVYSCVADAKRKTEINNIGLVCKGKFRTAGGFHWKYYDE